MLTTKSDIDGALQDIDLTSGGIYVGRDGRQLAEIEFNFSPKVKELLGELHLTKERLNSFDINLYLEHLGYAVNEKPQLRGSAVQGVREIFERRYEALRELPDHPRLFRFGEVFQSKKSMELVLSIAPEEGRRCESGDSLISNLRYSLDWKSDNQSAELTDQQVLQWYDELSLKVSAAEIVSPTKEGLTDVKQASGAKWDPPTISRKQVELAFDWVEEYAARCKDLQSLSEAMAFLCHAVQQVSSKLAMMTGDGYESISGTRLFSDPDQEKAISRVVIEHALLTSNPSELLETARVAALMVAIGGSALTGEQIARACDQDPSKRLVDANTYGMTLERQMQSGLRVLRLIHQLSTADLVLADVLQLYGKERLSIPRGYDGLGESSARVWDLRGLLDLQVWEPRPEAYRELQSHLVRIISNGRATLGPSDTIELNGLPQATE